MKRARTISASLAQTSANVPWHKTQRRALGATGRARLTFCSLLALVALAGCGIGPEQEAAQRATAVAFAQATSTAIAQPTVAAHETAEALASATSVEATRQTYATSTAVAEATRQSREVDTRIQAAVAATQAAIPTATSLPPTETPVPPTQTPVVIVVTQVTQPAPAPIYVPVPVPVPGGLAPQYILDAINESNNAYTVAKWTLNPNDLVGHLIGHELSDGQEYVRGLIRNRTKVGSTLVSGSVTSWSLASSTRAIATTNEQWHFINYDADRLTLKKDTGIRLYRNTYTIDFVGGYGWKVSLDDVANPNGDPL